MGEHVRAAAAAAGVRGRHLLQGQAGDAVQDLARFRRHPHGLFQVTGVVIGDHLVDPSRGRPQADDTGEEGGDVIGPPGPVFRLGSVDRVAGEQFHVVVLPGAAAGTAAGDQVITAGGLEHIDIVAGQGAHRVHVAVHQYRHAAAVLPLGDVDLDVVGGEHLDQVAAGIRVEVVERVTGEEGHFQGCTGAAHHLGHLFAQGFALQAGQLALGVETEPAAGQGKGRARRDGPAALLAAEDEGLQGGAEPHGGVEEFRVFESGENHPLEPGQAVLAHQGRPQGEHDPVEVDLGRAVGHAGLAHQAVEGHLVDLRVVQGQIAVEDRLGHRDLRPGDRGFHLFRPVHRADGHAVAAFHAFIEFFANHREFVVIGSGRPRFGRGGRCHGHTSRTGTILPGLSR